MHAALRERFTKVYARNGYSMAGSATAGAAFAAPHAEGAAGALVSRRPVWVGSVVPMVSVIGAPSSCVAALVSGAKQRSGAAAFARLGRNDSTSANTVQSASMRTFMTGSLKRKTSNALQEHCLQG